MTLWVVSGGGVGGRKHMRSRCFSKEKLRSRVNDTETAQKVQAFNFFGVFFFGGDRKWQMTYKNRGCGKTKGGSSGRCGSHGGRRGTGSSSQLSNWAI